MSATDNTGRDGHAGRDDMDEQDELDDDEEFDPAEYNTLIQLERLESLEEEMTELDVSSLDDIRRRIEELNAQLDAENQG